MRKKKIANIHLPRTRLANVLAWLMTGLPIVANAVEDQFQSTRMLLLFDNGFQQQYVEPLFGDLDSDGLTDIFFFASPDDGDELASMYWVANEGDRFPYGSREFRENYSPPFAFIAVQNAEYIGESDDVSSRRPFLEDINNDGRLDVVVFAGNEIHAAINTDSSPRFLAPTFVAPLDTATNRFDFVDLDNDDDLDVVDLFGIHINEGTPETLGPFSSSVSVGPRDFSLYGNISAFADINNDGYIDIIRSGSVIAQFLNNRTATPFTEESQPEVVQNSGERRDEIRLADLDGDGSQDMVAVGRGGNDYFLNEGPGSIFTNAPARILGPVERGSNVNLADFNSDGLIDVFMCGERTQKLYVNGGGSIPFAPAIVPAIGPATCSFLSDTGIHTEDIDRDGDTDLAWGSAYYLNNGFRQTPMPVLTVSNTSVFSDAGSMDVLIELSPPQTVPVSFEFATLEGLARPGEHYYGVFEEIRFLPGETEKVVRITILDGALPRYANFWGVFSHIDGANILNDSVSLSIRPPLEDTIPELRILDRSGVESSEKITFGVTLSETTSRTVSVSVETEALAGEATPGDDYFNLTQTIEFQPDERIKFFTVQVVSDLEPEEDELFGIKVTAIENATLISENITGTIEDDDDGPVRAFISVDQLEVNEGEIAQIPVELSRNLAQPVTVGIATRTKTATSGQDFYGFYQVLTFAAGETRKIVPLITLEDAIEEPVEELGVRLLTPGEGVDIGRNSGFSGEIPVKIQQAMTLPGEFSVSGVSCIEGDDCLISVSLSRASDAPVSVSLATRPLTAVAGRDFYGLSTVLTFAPDETAKMVTVTTLDNTVDEGDRSFEARIYNPVGAPIAVPITNPVIIRDND